MLLIYYENFVVVVDVDDGIVAADALMTLRTVVVVVDDEV